MVKYFNNAMQSFFKISYNSNGELAWSTCIPFSVDDSTHRSIRREFHFSNRWFSDALSDHPFFVVIMRGQPKKSVSQTRVPRELEFLHCVQKPKI